MIYLQINLLKYLPLLQQRVLSPSPSEFLMPHKVREKESRAALWGEVLKETNTRTPSKPACNPVTNTHRIISRWWHRVPVPADP
jgi:hypothetical protein